MTRRLAVLTALLCAFAGTAAAQGCEPKLGHPPLVRKGYMIAAINPTVAPIQYMNEDGEIVGLDVDFGNAIAKKLCLKMEWHSTQFATMIPILKEHRIDLINSFMVYTKERAEQVLDNHVKQTMKLAREIKAGTVPQPDLVVWPENSSDVDPLAVSQAGALITKAVRAVGAPVLPLDS